MKVLEVKTILNNPKMANKNTNFRIVEKYKPGIKKPGNPTTKDLILKILNRLDKIDDFIVDQRKFNQYVLDMFKKHKWIK